MRNSENVLNSLAGHSQDPNYKFERLYRLMYNENLYALAYQNIAPQHGQLYERRRRSVHRRNERETHIQPH